MALSGPEDVVGRVLEPEEVAEARWRKVRKAFTMLAALIGLQAYYTSKVVVPEGPPDLAGIDTILVYTGGVDRIHGALALAEKVGPKWVVYSAGMKEQAPKYRGKRKVEIRMVRGAYTTDQNARMAVPELKKLDAKSVLLMTSWYHMPRALLATRIYLLGSGIRCQYLAVDQPPQSWWWPFDWPRKWAGTTAQGARQRGLIWMEGARMWGTIMRMGLAVVGVEYWPRPAGYPKGQ